MWRLARGLEKLRSQVNEQWPKRSKVSDGAVGDVAHSSRLSDHNPDPSGVVRAIDLTHDPASGFDSYAFADYLLKKQDPRVKYIISNNRIGSGPLGIKPGVWRDYDGKNPHDHHVHISTVEHPLADRIDPWDIGPVMAPVAYKLQPAPLKQGSTGHDVKRLQAALFVEADGYFGTKTKMAVQQFQASERIPVDGIVGPLTLSRLFPDPPTRDGG